MAEVSVERGGHRVAFLSKIHVSVDGQEVAKLKHGESVKFEVPVGEHTFHAHTTGLTDASVEVEVPEEGASLVVGSKTGIGAATSAAVSSGKGSKLPLEFWNASAGE